MWVVWEWVVAEGWMGTVSESPCHAACVGIFHLFLWIMEALLSVLTAVVTVLLALPLREVVPELAYLHQEERVHSKIQPVPYDLCTHSEQERDTISKRQGDLVRVPCCCRGTAMCN